MVAALSAVVIVPSLVLAPLGAPTAGSMIGLGGLGIAFVARTTNLRVTLYAVLGLGLACLLAANGTTHPVVGVLTLMAVAAGHGLTARWHWQKAFVVLPITMAFVASESVLAPPLELEIAFAAAMSAYALLVGLLIRALSRTSADNDDNDDKTAPAPLSWQRTLTYAGLLTSATAVTATIALTGDWGHTGGWLIMTPFIVIQPYVRDGWHKAVNRALGTVAGLLIADGLARLIGQGPTLATLGYGFGVLAIIATVKRWPYAIYATFLTPAVVILESVGRPVEETGYERIIATVIGVAVSLAAMAIAAPIYRRESLRADLENR